MKSRCRSRRAGIEQQPTGLLHLDGSISRHLLKQKTTHLGGFLLVELMSLWEN